MLTDEAQLVIWFRDTLAVRKLGKQVKSIWEIRLLDRSTSMSFVQTTGRLIWVRKLPLRDKQLTDFMTGISDSIVVNASLSTESFEYLKAFVDWKFW